MGALQQDDNLQPGISYCFTFQFSAQPNVQQVLLDLQNNAPAFVAQPNVSLTTPYLNISFLYTGDGSDIVSDVFGDLLSSFAVDVTGNWTAFQAAIGTAGITQINPTSGGGGPAYSFSFRNLLPSFLGGATVTPDQAAANTAAEKAQIASVAQNSSAAYGSGSPAATTAAGAVATASASASADQNSIAGSYNALLASISNSQLFGFSAVLLIVGAAIVLYFFFISGGMAAARRSS